MIRFRKVAIASMTLAISLVVLGCKPVASFGPPDSRLTLTEGQHASIAVEPVTTPETVSPEGQPLGREEGCERAIEILATCASETRCSTDIAMLLPSAARSQYVLLTQQSWFVPQRFDRYCETVCRAKSPIVNKTTFERDVCIAALPTGGSARKSVIALTVGGLEMPTDGVPLSKVIAQLGHPTHASDSPYTCDSAFQNDGTRLYVYPNATFETDGAVAVLRSMKAADANQVTIPGIASKGRYIEADMQKLRGFSVEDLRDHTFRTSTALGGDLETAYDFIFVDGKLARVEYWIGC